MKTIPSIILTASLAIASSAVADEEVNPSIRYDGFTELTVRLEPVRANHRVTEAEFIHMAVEPETIVLDARSKDRYERIHIKGAIHLALTDFTEEALQELIPDKSTRILIYCNNNFENEPVNFASKMVTVALNIQSYINLHAYGYTNVYELRTPLTTFRLYSDLLGKDAVHGEKRTHYLRVLTREADRLTHLVENVLAFSRIENTRARTHKRATTCVEMLADFRPRHEDRLATAGLTLETTLAPDVATMPLHTDTAVVEHILFNLIDNAAKYAAGSTPPSHSASPAPSVPASNTTRSCKAHVSRSRSRIDPSEKTNNYFHGKLCGKILAAAH